MRFRGKAFRAHHPQWSFEPLSGKGAALHGGRYNPKGVPALYLALDFATAVAEANQGFRRKFIHPMTIVSYEIDCDDIIDLRSMSARRKARVSRAEIACAWMELMLANKPVPSHELMVRLVGKGCAGIVVPSFAPDASGANLVLWAWGPDLPHRIVAFDPHRSLPKDRRSWTDDDGGH